jgi:hypothetical protein
MVSGTFMFLLRVIGWLGLGTFIALCGAIYFLQAREHADTITQRISRAHPFWRLWLPACFYTNAILLLQLRIAAAGVVLIGLVLMVSALAALVYHP